MVGTDDILTDDGGTLNTIIRAHRLSTVYTVLEVCLGKIVVTDLTVGHSFGAVIPAAPITHDGMVTAACHLTRRTLDPILATECVVTGRTLVEMYCTERL